MMKEKQKKNILWLISGCIWVVLMCIQDVYASKKDNWDEYLNFDSSFTPFSGGEGRSNRVESTVLKSSKKINAVESNVDPARNFKSSTNYSCNYPNDCFVYADRPVCFHNKLTGLSTCVPCNPVERSQPHVAAPPWALEMKDCYCKPDEYCISDPMDDNIGFCRKFSADKQNGVRILGRPCLTSLQGDGMKTVAGQDDFMFCGKINYDASGNARWQEWEGSCQMGKCYKCGQTPVPSLPLAQCQDGRSCVKSKMEYATAGILSWAYWADNAVISFAGLLALMVFFVILMVIIVLITLGICYMVDRKKKSMGPMTRLKDTSCVLDVNSDKHAYDPLLFDPEELTQVQAPIDQQQ